MIVHMRRLGGCEVLVLLLALPIVMTGVGLSALEVWRIQSPNAPLFTTPRSLSLADAIQSGDVLQTYELLRAGHNPQQPIAVRHPILTGGQVVMVQPLLWAVALESNQVVPLLLTFDGPVEPALAAQAACLAERIGNDDAAQLLRLHASISTPCAKESGVAVLINESTRPD